MSVMALDMADAMAILVSYEKFGAWILLHMRALICLFIVLYNTVSLLYLITISLPNLF